MFSQKLLMDVFLNQNNQYHTKPNQTKPTVNLLKNSQNKSDFDETFTVALDGSYLKPYKTIANQTKPTVNHLLNRKNKSDFNETFTVASDGCCLKPDQTIPNQAKQL